MFGDPARDLWSWDQWLSFRNPGTAFFSSRASLRGETSNFGDSLSSFAAATVRNFGVELTGKAGAQSKLATPFSTPTSTYGFEIGRTYLLSKKTYGRISVDLFTQNIQPVWFVKLALATGFLSNASFPWSFHFAVDYSLAFNRSSEWIGIGLHFLHDAVRWDEFTTIQSGMFVRWRTRSPSASTPAGPNDWMLFSLGPSAQWNSKSYGLTLNVPFRVWVDREVVAGTDSFPQEFSIPAIELAGYFAF